MKEALQAFADDLIEVCKKHDMMIINADEEGFTLSPIEPGKACLLVAEISPRGIFRWPSWAYGGDTFPPEYSEMYRYR